MPVPFIAERYALRLVCITKVARYRATLSKGRLFLHLHLPLEMNRIEPLVLDMLQSTTLLVGVCRRWLHLATIECPADDSGANQSLQRRRVVFHYRVPSFERAAETSAQSFPCFFFRNFLFFHRFSPP